MVAEIGKGRLSAKLAKKIPDGLRPPPYITAAIQFVSDRV
jgi:putative ATP-dependent endonuclease of OLD family